MGSSDQRRRTDSPWRILLALVCVLLVLVTGTVQVAHTHADGADTHASCSLCAVAHITVHLAQTPAPAQAPAAIVTMLQALPPAAIASALSTFALFTRPPPTAALPA
jgi:hypothetical protein